MGLAHGFYLGRRELSKRGAARVEPSGRCDASARIDRRPSFTNDTLGFWVSWDGGSNWAKPAGWISFAQSQNLTTDDVYDIAVDPTNLSRVLVSSHSPYSWDSETYGEAAGLLESKDGGDSWISHKPHSTWGYGHSIDFLYEPTLGIRDANTWLLGTQGDGLWRTTDAGEHWTKVSNTSIAHGGDDIYYTKAGVLYAGSTESILRSTDNGRSWTPVGPSGAYSTVVHVPDRRRHCSNSRIESVDSSGGWDIERAVWAIVSASGTLWPAS